MAGSVREPSRVETVAEDGVRRERGADGEFDAIGELQCALQRGRREHERVDGANVVGDEARGDEAAHAVAEEHETLRVSFVDDLCEIFEQRVL